jgi:hypothetical protein
MPAHTVPYPAATIQVITGRRRHWRARLTLAALAALALLAIALNVVPGLGLSAPAPAARHHAAAARPVPPPPVHVTVGQRAYSCTVVLPPANIKGRP